MNIYNDITPQQQKLLAALLVFTGAVFFSSKAIMVKLAYRYEVDSVSLLALRMLFSLPLYLGVLAISNRKLQRQNAISKRDWFYILLLGFAGYYLASLFDFIGLQYVSASMERLILFMYPTIVFLISAFVFRKKIIPIQYWALLLTYLGITIAFSENLSVEGGGAFLLGAGFIFLSALTFAIYIAGSGQLLPRIGTLRYTSYAMSVAGFAVLVHHGIVHRWDLFNFAPQVYGYGIAMAIFATVLPSFMVSEGIRIIGANNAAIIGSVGPISTIVLAYIFLDERLGFWQWIGTFFVIGGVLLISLYKKG